MACPGRPQQYSPDGTPWTVRYTSDGRCIDTPAWTPLGQGAPIYGSGGFASTNPAASVVRQFTDASGRTFADVWQAAPGYLGQICLSNCGAGTGFFGLGGEAANIARTVGTVIATIAPALTPAAPFVAAGQQLSQNVQRSQSGMSLNIGGILSSVGGILSGANFGDYSGLSSIAGGAFNIAGAALTPSVAPPQPMYAAAPIYQPQLPVYQQTQPAAQPVMSAAPAFAVAGRAIAAVTAPILAKIAVKLGLRARPSLTRAMDMVRKAAKLLQSPEAVAVALGITVGELAQLITASSSRKRRRMNPANSKALKRAARRIKSFHKLCTHTDVLRGRSRGSRGRSVACGSCKKSPCRC